MPIDLKLFTLLCLKNIVLIYVGNKYRIYVVSTRKTLYLYIILPKSISDRKRDADMIKTNLT